MMQEIMGVAVRAPFGSGRIAVGMSGGVDSAVSAALLQRAGWKVTGVFLDCWRGPGCRADEDRKDALGVALQLGIPFEVLDFKQAYKDKVVEYFFAEYAAGRTPNPDVYCNKEIKFGLFYDWAMRQKFEAVATGHYAQSLEYSTTSDQKTSGLFSGPDAKKDQSYFLYLLREEQLSKIVFPVGRLPKKRVRELATELQLPVAKKPDSQGICFIGEVNVANFLRERLGENLGEVVDTNGEVIGEHNGLWFYTIGQRHGFRLLPKTQTKNGAWKHILPPFYVIRKDAEKNQLVVGYGADTLASAFKIAPIHWISVGDVLQDGEQKKYQVRIRHGGQKYPATLTGITGGPQVQLEQAVPGIAEGQSAVIYDGERCVGGGLIRCKEW